MSATSKTHAALSRAVWNETRSTDHDTAPEWVGIIPAAGEGRRLGLGGYPKELIPIHYRRNGAARVRPVLAIETTVAAMADAGVSTVCVVISEAKLDIVRVLSDGASLGCKIVYVVQSEARGLWDAIECGLASFAEKNILLALPDTVVEPENALKTLKASMETIHADLTLGVFPTSHPEAQAPVQHEGEKVHAIWEKPDPAPVSNTWGIAAWNARFTAHLPQFRQCISEPQPSITHAFIQALRAEMKVSAVPFQDGRYVDLGTPEGLAETFDPVSGSPRCIKASFEITSR